MEYFYPKYRLKIGNYIVTEGAKLEYLQDNQLKLDWCEIILSEKVQSIISANYNDIVTLELGYDKYFPVFKGYVTDIENNKYKCKSQLLDVQRTEITNSFLECTPEDVFTYILKTSGISNFDINIGLYHSKNLLNISKMNGIKALKYVENEFQLENISYLFENDVFKIIKSKNTKDIYKFVYGVNIKDLEKIDDNTYCLRTVAVPFITVLDTIKVTHKGINGEYIVDKIIVNINESGFIETKLYFKVWSSL